jgi:glycogen debranching enzyme
MIRQSMRFMLSNAHGGLMHSERPDWWDIGHVYGARSYLTTLMIRALRSYTFIFHELGYEPESLREYIDLADDMQQRLVSELWDDQAGFLMNMLDSATVDRHYYSGSLLGAAFGVLDESRTERLLTTAREVLLDEQIGIRNAMPPDFLDLIEEYRFNGPEVGAPYRYMNGGVWPQGIAWYALGLLSAGHPDSARAALTRYLTLDGIRQSPNGQPALFEYRNTDREAPDYGQIDKTTFLWAGGWYLHVLYQLAGARDS